MLVYTPLYLYTSIPSYMHAGLPIVGLGAMLFLVKIPERAPVNFERLLRLFVPMGKILTVVNSYNAWFHRAHACIFLYIYASVYAYTHDGVHTDLHKSIMIYVFMHACNDRCMYACMHVLIFAYIVCMCMQGYCIRHDTHLRESAAKCKHRTSQQRMKKVTCHHHHHPGHHHHHHHHHHHLLQRLRNEQIWAVSMLCMWTPPCGIILWMHAVVRTTKHSCWLCLTVHQRPTWYAMYKGVWKRVRCVNYENFVGIQGNA